MSEDQSIQLAWSVGALVLVGSGLIARRLPIGQTLKMMAAWVAIFAGALVVVSYREEIRSVWDRVTGDLVGSQTVGTTLRVPMAEDGHFWIQARVNGASGRFLIDSGATTTALSGAMMRAANVSVDADALPTILDTANGAIEARRARVVRFEVGPIVSTDLAVVTSPSFGNTNVIGMNFLSTLKSWRVEGSTLVLEPKGTRK